MPSRPEPVVTKLADISKIEKVLPSEAEIRYHQQYIARIGESDDLMLRSKSRRLHNPHEKLDDPELVSKVVNYYGLLPDQVNSVSVYPDSVNIVASAVGVERDPQGRPRNVRKTVKKIFYVEPPRGWMPPDTDWSSMPVR